MRDDCPTPGPSLDTEIFLSGHEIFIRWHVGSRGNVSAACWLSLSAACGLSLSKPAPFDGLRTQSCHICHASTVNPDDAYPM